MRERFALFLAPLVVWLLWLVLPLLRREGITRTRFSVGLSLLTLAYFLGVVRRAGGIH